MIAKLKFVDFNSDVLIQLVDMCCSAIAYKYKKQEDMNNSDIYLNMLGSRIKNIWDFK